MDDNSEHAGMTCEEFQQKLPILAEAGEKLYGDPHLKSCAMCRSLVVDLEKIAVDAGRVFRPEN